ncbi:DUF2829 domain-containing protein [Xenorhabdus bovienii]|uniref:Thoeris anti-defense Tad2 family protein n=1 Tax=Xenorhabdus bovienii TaxID=40576 RepID=UPI0023B30301|nr:MW1434 family type I TA system toxin [Xenorhabdus bovienii]MDE9540652.1 DUF2829 domain-containing protein [Xenorhabdus bovienii]MDE9553045.1 DUF2829 domain-containing protein [Xenorhabdus bovienii]MDE9557863.1 DUF2829 domain-containing protein [Xenorhabdus bovienii]
MSEVITPEITEAKNKNPEYECESQYQFNADEIAVRGTFSWALIKLKKSVGLNVVRRSWADKVNYHDSNNKDYPPVFLQSLFLSPRRNGLVMGVDTPPLGWDGSKYDYLTHIDAINSNGNVMPWQPTQEDMMACDWTVLL